MTDRNIDHLFRFRTFYPDRPASLFFVEEEEGCMAERGFHVVYRFYDVDFNLLYIGIASDPVRRFKQHAKTSIWFNHVHFVDFEVEWSRRDAIKRETMLISVLHPEFNIACLKRSETCHHQWKRESSQRVFESYESIETVYRCTVCDLARIEMWAVEYVSFGYVPPADNAPAWDGRQMTGQDVE